MRTRTRTALAALPLAAVLAGCGSSPSPEVAADPSTTQARPQDTAPVTAPGAATTAIPAADWYGYHRDPAHSGYAAGTPAATTLKGAWTAPLDALVQAGPLVIGNRVIAAVENNTVYALDRATGTVLWRRHLAAPVQASSLPCGNISPVVGITGTPVYDPATRRVFAVTTTPSGASVRHTLVGLDVATGTVATRAAADPPGADPRVENQRGALSLSLGRVLVPYGGHAGDCGAFHGYLVSIVAKDGSATKVFRTGTGTEAGMWQPSGAAVDAAGYAYPVSGNGRATSPPYDGSDSVHRVDPRTGTSVSMFAPAGWAAENARDLDLGSSGVAIVGHVLWVQGKTSTGYLLRDTALGGIGHPLAKVTGACATQFGGPAVHGSTVFAPCTDGVRRLVVHQDGTSALGWRAPANVTGSPVVGGGRVWSLDPDGGTLYSLDEATGRTVATIGVGQTVRFATPALSGNLVLVPTRTGITAVSGA